MLSVCTADGDLVWLNTYSFSSDHRIYLCSCLLTLCRYCSKEFSIHKESRDIFIALLFVNLGPRFWFSSN